MLNVVCVQTGNYLGRGVEYVHKLCAAVREHLTVPHKFHVVTDDAASNYPSMAVKPAKHKGWWAKLDIFRPMGMFEGRVLFLDLDTFIVKNIDHIAAYDGPFATLHDFWNPKGLGPAVMLFDVDYAQFIWREWAAMGFPMGDPRGDQGWIEGRKAGHFRREADILQELFPDEFVSFKTHCTHSLPEKARVVCFHGKPRPHEAPGWAREHWEGAYGLVG